MTDIDLWLLKSLILTFSQPQDRETNTLIDSYMIGLVVTLFLHYIHFDRLILKELHDKLQCSLHLTVALSYYTNLSQ